MTGQLLLAIAFLGPPQADLATSVPELVAVPWSADDLRAEFRECFSRLRKIDQRDPSRDVPDLVLLYHALVGSEALGRSEQVRLRQAVEYRLEEAAERLRHQRSRESARSRKASPSASRNDNVVAVATGGGQEASNVQQLIDLIEATVQPESWENNGGRASIRYYAPLHVLVIRNTQQAHREIGGLIGTLGEP